MLDNFIITTPRRTAQQQYVRKGPNVWLVFTQSILFSGYPDNVSVSTATDAQAAMAWAQAQENQYDVTGPKEYWLIIEGGETFYLTDEKPDKRSARDLHWQVFKVPTNVRGEITIPLDALRGTTMVEFAQRFMKEVPYEHLRKHARNS